jgi:hypothetical protein
VNKVVKVLSAIKVFLVICLFAGFAFATTPSGSPAGIGSSNGPQVGINPKTCGFPTENRTGWLFLILFVLLGVTGAIMTILTVRTKSYKPGEYPELNSPNYPVPGGEAHVIEPSGASKAVTLHPGSNSIGRDSNQDIQLDDPKVSKQHADLNVSPEGRYVVTDLGSQNGTTVNGTQISQQELYQGDQIGLGDSRIIV